jgi:hypothetical protein
MSHVASLLEALAQTAATNRELEPGELQPGLSRAELEAALRADHFPGVPPESWFHLYQWRNGTVDDGRDPPLFHYHRFAPLDEALSQRGHLEALYREPPNVVPLLPIFTFMGEWYVVDCSKDPKEYGRILFLFQDVTIAYDSLETMLESILDCYEQGAYRYENGEVIVDDQRVAQIKLARNSCRGAEPYLAMAAHP